MAAASSNNFQRNGNIAGTQIFPASSQQTANTGPQAPGLSTQEATHQHFAYQNSGTSAAVHISAPVQLATVNVIASTSQGDQAYREQANAYYIAAGKGDLATVKRLLNGGMPIDARKGSGDIGPYAIAKAAQEGHLNVVTYLTEMGACAESRTMAIVAATLMLSCDDHPAGLKEIVKHLILSFPAAEARKLVLPNPALALDKADSRLFSELCDEVENDITDFQMAAKEGNVTKLAAHIASGMRVGAQVNVTDPTALVQATKNRKLHAVVYLLAQNPTFIDKRDAILSIAYELAFASDAEDKAKLTKVVATILDSEIKSIKLRDEMLACLRERGDSDIADQIHDLNFR